MMPSLPSLLLMSVAWLSASGHEAIPTDATYSIVERIDTSDSVLAVVRQEMLLYLVYDESIIGAEFDHPEFRKQTAFPGFTIMQCAAYLAKKPTRALQLGLGIGTVPSFLREQGIPTDVVELNPAVVTLASTYFEYETCHEDAKTTCANGQTFVMDGLTFLASTPDKMGVKTDGNKRPYDLIIVDVYTGSNPVLFFVQEKIQQIRDTWLTQDGVLIMNFVGFMHGPRAVVPRSVYRTLQSVFPHVKSFREMEEADHPKAANIVFYASNHPFSFNLPTSEEYQNPEKLTYFSIVKNFPSWEIFTDLQDPIEIAMEQNLDDNHVQFQASTAPEERVLTQADHGQEAFQEIHNYLQQHMRQRVLDRFPAAFWNELKRKA